MGVDWLVARTNAIAAEVIDTVQIIESNTTDFHCYPEAYDWSQFKPDTRARGHIGITAAVDDNFGPND